MQSKRIILIAVMILSALGFVIDRVFYSRPASASAEETSPDGPAAPSPLPSPKDPGVTTIDTATTDDPSLAWLNQIEDAPETPRDIFAPSADLIAFLDAQKPEPGSGNALIGDAEAENDAARFEAEHTLQATFLSDRKMMAVIDGKVVRIGSIVDGYTIALIESDRVICLLDDKRAVLRMVMSHP